MVLQSDFRGKAPETERAGVRPFLAMSLDLRGVDEGGLADDAPGMVFLGVVLHLVEGLEPLLLAGETGERHVERRRQVMIIRQGGSAGRRDVSVACLRRAT